jgi:uncharacterized protein (TIGR02145 family)
MALPSKCNFRHSTADSDCAKSPKHQGICPSGWHIPSNAEWETLRVVAGYAERKLQATSGWNLSNGTDDYGFAALPGGSGTYDGRFLRAGREGIWWAASESNSGGWYAWQAICYDTGIIGGGDHAKEGFFSVRCIQD